jgi:hypothetical protein
MIPIGAGELNPAEQLLLRRAADWPEHRSLAGLTVDALQSVTAEEGVDFATALLFDRLTKSPAHSPFIEGINHLQQCPRPAGPPVTFEVVIVPGALYVERPDNGADGKIIRNVAGELGLRTHVIPLESFGPCSRNAALIRHWLTEHSSNQLILVSLSKGGADLKMALESPAAPYVFRNVFAWVNVCGPLFGSRMANWVLDNWIRREFFRWKATPRFPIRHRNAIRMQRPARR